MKKFLIATATILVLAGSFAFETPDQGGVDSRVLSLENSGVTALTGCAALGPKREAAVKDLAADKAMCLAKCSANLVMQPMEEILKTCGLRCGQPTGDDLQNFKDLIFGQKAGAAAAGAKIPDAPTDAGASTR